MQVEFQKATTYIDLIACILPKPHREQGEVQAILMIMYIYFEYHPETDASRSISFFCF